MAKLRLNEAQSYEFEYKTVLKPRDINYGGHLGNDSVISLLQEARLAFYGSRGCTELDLGDGKTGSILSVIGVNYKHQGYLNDEVSIFVHIDDVKATSFYLYYKMTRGEDIICLAETQIAAFNYDTNKLESIPAEFIKKFNISRDY